MSDGQPRVGTDGILKAPAHVRESSLLGLVNVVLRNRWLIVLPALLAGAVAIGIALSQPRTYTATAAFVPQARQAAGALQGLTAQLGLGVGAGDPMQSPQFYVELIKSREILRDVAATQYSVTTDSGPVAGTLHEIYRPSGETPERRREALLRRLGQQVQATHSQQTGIVRVSVSTPYQELSARVADRILELVSAFNLQTRQSQARAERRFVEQRLGEVHAELRGAENRLQSFLQSNRNFTASPALRIEQQRLERDVSTKRTLYTELVQNVERARMEEVRDTPVITVFGRPEVPALPDPRGLLRYAVLALLAGGAVGAFLAVVREYLRRLREQDAADYAQFRRLRHESLRDITHPWQPVARLVQRRSGEL